MVKLSRLLILFFIFTLILPMHQSANHSLRSGSGRCRVPPHDGTLKAKVPRLLSRGAPHKATSAQEPPRKIISLTPASTEILFALGMDKEIIGISSYCNWPPEARYKQVVGSFSSPDIEKIISLNPDIVILTGMEQAYIKNILSSLKIKHITVDPSSIEELLESIRKIGRITAKTQEANALTADIKTAIKVIGSKFQDIPEAKRPSVYVEIWHDPIMSVGRSSFIDDMVRKAGGKNVTSDLKRCYSRVDAETIIWRDPDVIILTYMKNNIWIKKEFERRLGWKKITAVKNNRVFSDIDPDLIIRPGPRIKEGLQELYKRFYEE